jgi:hypothetical protein
MKKFLSSLCAAALAAAMAGTSLVPANAAPFVPSVAPASTNVIQVQEGGVPLSRAQRRDQRNWGGGPDFRRDFRRGGREIRRGDFRRDFRRGGFYRDGRSAFYNGHRGYYDYRPGYRRHNGFWFPAAAFITGAIVGGALAAPAPVYRGGGGSAHVEWCYNRYRSYRASDNTFQPYNGPRRACYSPYS